MLFCSIILGGTILCFGEEGDIYSFSPDPKQGMDNILIPDSCGAQNSSDQVRWVKLSSVNTDTMHIKISWMPANTGSYTQHYGVHLKAFHYDGVIWREIYSHLMGPDDFTLEDGTIGGEDGWITGGHAEWGVTNDSAYSGKYSAGSDPILVNNQSSFIKRTIEKAGILSF
ncbi:MAG: hypothetical protein ACMUJM_16535 [bacterium]